MLGGDVLDIELTAQNVYAAYESAVLEYSYIINLHQSKNIISDALGSMTGTFDHDGQMLSGTLSASLSGTQAALKFPKTSFGYAKRISDRASEWFGIGGTVPTYSASIALSNGVQNYNLQELIISQSLNTSSLDFYQKIDDKRIGIKRVYYKSPRAT